MTKNVNLAKILDQDDVFAASITVGNSTVNVLANSTIVKLANSTVNTGIAVPTAGQYSGSYYLHANGTWQLVAAGATPGGANTQVQFNDSTALGGTAGFTFNKDTNNVLIANTLTVGASGNTINSIVWTGKAYTANDSTNLGGTAAASYQLNSTLAANVATMSANNATWHGTSIFANSTGAYPTSNSVGAVLGNTISRVIITGNSATFNSTLAAGDTTITGFVNATVSVNSALHTIGTTFIANTLGVYHTGTMNAAVHSTTGVVINATAVTATSNTILLGNSIGRFVLSANSADIGPNFVANTLAYHTAVMNAASHTTTGVTANVTGVYPTSNSSGQALGLTAQRWVLFANSIDVSSTWTANGALGTTSQVLTANSIGGAYWAAPSGGGNVTKVGTPVDDQVGVWTGDGTIEGTAGFTFSAATNNAVIANTLTVGTATVNSTLAVLSALNVTNQVNTATLLATGLANVSALNVTNQTNTATLFVTTSANVGTAVLANSIGLTTTGFVNAATVVNSASHTVGTAFTANATLVNAAAINITGAVNTATLMATGLANVNALNVTNQVNAATMVATTSMAVGNTTQNTTAFGIAGNTTTAPTLVLSSNSTTSILYGNSTITGTPTITVQNSTTNAVLTSLDVKLGGTATVANTLGVYTGIVNAATHSVGTAFTANSTLVNAAALNVVNQTNTATLFVTTSANVGTAVLANSIGLTTTGFVNAVTVVNSASHTIGTTLVANTLGVYHTGIMNAAVFTTTGFRANVTHVVPTSNSSGQNFGNTISRWQIFANTIDLTTTFTANGASGSAAQVLTSNSTGGAYWAAAGGGSTIATKNYQTFTATAGQTAFVLTNTFANTLVDVFYNGVHLANTEWTANSSTNTVTLGVGANLNAVVEVSAYSNATVSSFIAIPGGSNTTIQFNDSGQINGTAGFAFDKTVNTFFVGNSSVNTTINSAAIAISISPTVNLTANSVIVQLANTTGTANLTPTSLKISNSTVRTTVELDSLDIVTSSTNNISVPTANGLSYFSKYKAGRMLPVTIGASGWDTPLQPHLMHNPSGYMIPNPGGTTISAMRMTMGNTVAFTSRTPTSANTFMSMHRIAQTTGATAGTSCEFRNTILMYWLGNATNLGGFYIVSRFGIATSAAQGRAFIGLHNNTAVMSNANPSAQTNIIGFGFDSAQTTWRVMTANATTSNTIDTTMDCTTGNTHWYEGVLFSAPNSQQVGWQLTNLTNGNVAIGTCNSACLPSNTTFLTWKAWCNNGSTAGVEMADWGGVTIETNL